MGSGSNIVPDNEACPPENENDEEMKYYDGNTQKTREMSLPIYAGIDKRWHKDVGSCGSTISKNSDEDITIVKKLVYHNSDTRDGTEPIKLGSDIWLTGNEGRVAVTFTCKFASTFTAKSDEIEIEAGKAVEDGDSSVLGSDLYARISWTVSSSLSANLHYYVNSCEVKQLTKTGVVDNVDQYSYATGNGNIKIFDRAQCAAGVVDVEMAPGNHVHGKDNWNFNFRSFSFNKGGNDRQQLECEVKFCINKDYKDSAGNSVPNECAGVMANYNANKAAANYCTNNALAAFQWAKVTLSN